MRGFYSKAHFGAEKTHIGSLFLEKMHFGAEKKIIGSLFLARSRKTIPEAEKHNYWLIFLKKPLRPP